MGRGLLFGISLACQAQTAPGSASDAGAAPFTAPASAAASAPAVPASAAPPMPQAATGVQGCRPLSDQAMAKDMAAVTARSKKMELAEQAKLFNEAVLLWTQASEQCEGRAKDRALMSREDDQQLLAQISEALSAGPRCASGHKDAAVLQDMAKLALTERRWKEAASLFRKAENMWDYASERCTGNQQEIANRRRDQSAQDGHNAQYCAPLFEAARESTQKYRSAAANLSKEEKQDASMVAETLWRDALDNCQGPAVLEIASNNAKTLARERGTPWVPRIAAASQTASAETPSQATLGSRKSMASTTGSALTSAPMALASVTSAMNAPTPSLTTLIPIPSTQATPAAASAAQSAPLETVPAKRSEPEVATPGVLTAGTTRFVGQFVRDEGATTISGSGKVTWATGDVFEGSMVKGLRQGKGTIVWANGQRYAGDWVMDKPTGLAKIHFVNGNDYEGQVLDGTPQGTGRMRYASGDEFVGQFKNGEPDVRGVYSWRNGQRYDGVWANGRPNGQGKLQFATGNQYEGTVVDGVPQGQGRMVFAGGEIYEGQFTAGEPDGEGAFTWPSGDQYVGQWKAGKKHGKGAFTWKSGDCWEGVYDNDLQVN